LTPTARRFMRSLHAPRPYRVCSRAIRFPFDRLVLTYLRQRGFGSLRRKRHAAAPPPLPLFRPPAVRKGRLVPVANSASWLLNGRFPAMIFSFALSLLGKGRPAVNGWMRRRPSAGLTYQHSHPVGGPRPYPPINAFSDPFTIFPQDEAQGRFKCRVNVFLWKKSIEDLPRQQPLPVEAATTCFY